MRLYKYIPAERFAFFDNGLVRFTPPSEFNDPTELLFNLSGVEEFITLGKSSLDKPEAIRQMLREKTPEWRTKISSESGNRKNRRANIKMLKQFASPRSIINKLSGQLDSLIDNEIDSFRSDLSEFPKQIWHERNQYGIVCLTENQKSLPMWAHYAGNHDGALVEMDFGKSIFVREFEKSGIFFDISKVVYSGNKTLDINKNGNNPNPALVKNPDWEYEKEWRIIGELAQINCFEESAGNNLARIRPESVISVTLGIGRKTRELLAKDASRISNGYFSNASIYYAELDTDSVDLNYIEFGGR